jgi:hypothetical protein
MKGICSTKMNRSHEGKPRQKKWLRPLTSLSLSPQLMLMRIFGMIVSCHEMILKADRGIKKRRIHN